MITRRRSNCAPVFRANQLMVAPFKKSLMDWQREYRAQKATQSGAQSARLRTAVRNPMDIAEGGRVCFERASEVCISPS